jgi:hypothetical protein
MLGTYHCLPLSLSVLKEGREGGMCLFSDDMSKRWLRMHDHHRHRHCCCVGAYSPADADVSSTVPVKYGYCDDSTTNSTGK